MQYPFSPLPPVLARLEKTLSIARLNRFMPPSGDRNHALRLCIWNARLCEEFYIPLQFTEVALRNGINRRLIGVYGPNWPDNPRFSATIPDHHKDSLSKIVTDERTARGAGYSVDHVIAGLPFGFWHNLMGRTVAHILWSHSLYAPFPHLPAEMTREDVYQRLEQFRTFRNKVMHHYAIFDKAPKLEYDNIKILLSWMCPHATWLVGELCNPLVVIQNRPKA